MIAAILVDVKHISPSFVYRRIEIEIPIIVARRAILPLEAQTDRQAGRQAGRWSGVRKDGEGWGRVGWDGMGWDGMG